MPPRVVLMGPPGAGKSSVGAELARLLGVPLRDTDMDIEAATGKRVSDIFVDSGEEHFRALEVDAVAAAVTDHQGVLSLGGGAPLALPTQEVLKAYARGGGVIVFLDVSLTAAVPRVGLNATRPLLLGNPRQQWLKLMSARRPIYESLATRSVLTDDYTPGEVAEQIISLLPEASS